MTHPDNSHPWAPPFPDDHQADELELAEIEHQLLCLEKDISDGRAPRWARRALYPHELTARTNFAAIVDEVNAVAIQLLVMLGDHRARFLALLRADLAALGSVDAVVARIQAAQALGINSVPGATELIAKSVAQTRPLLERLLETSATRLRQEAAAQGVDIAGVTALSTRTAEQIERQARRLAVLPQADGLRAVAEKAVAVSSGATIYELMGVVDQAGRSLSEKPLGTLATQAGSSAVGLGRLEAAGQAGVTPAEIYASELLDRNTCDPCYHVDGKKYPTMEALLKDYSAGVFKDCEGGWSCRGTGVIVWSTEAPTEKIGEPTELVHRIP